MASAADLGISDVLEVVRDIFQIEGEVRGDEYRIHCVVHTDAHPSADINLDSGLWSCFSCGAKGDLAGLGSVVLKKSRNEIVELLKPGAPDAVLASVQKRLEVARSKRPGKVATRPQEALVPPLGRYARQPMRYMRRRGFTKETLRRWHVRYAEKETFVRVENGEEKTFSISHSIAIPIRNADQKIVAWCYRATDMSLNWQPKMIYTPGFDLTGNWFGLHLHKDEDEIFVCEGPLDAMWLDQYGYPALAMMGSNHKNPRKFRMLSDFRKIIVVPDYDRGGIAMAYRLGLLLRGKVPVDVVLWPKVVVQNTGKETPDPQDVRSEHDLHLLLGRRQTWTAWCLRNNLPMRQT